MKNYIYKALATVGFCIAASTSAHAVLIEGVEFPDGEISFADSVYSYSPGPDVGAGYDDPNAALGIPDYSGANNTAVSLGNGGSLILQFTDNSLTTSGDASADLWIFEEGPAVEWFNVAISTNATDWIDLGDVLGQPTGIDIDPIAGVISGTLYSFVRLTDIDPEQSGSPFGEADIDAVGAISSGEAVDDPTGDGTVSVPEPAPMTLFALAASLLLLRNRKTNT